MPAYHGKAERTVTLTATSAMAQIVDTSIGWLAPDVPTG
jgi:hypothetical protein